MESWRKVWRDGLMPLLTTHSLSVLRDALIDDDERLLQGATTAPPPLETLSACAVEAACVLGFCGWQAEGLETVGEVEEFFARHCFEIDQRLGEPAGCRWFLNWFDQTPRAVMRANLLPEVQRALALRQSDEWHDYADAELDSAAA